MFQFRRRLYIILSALTPFLLFQFYILHLLTDGNDDTEQIAYQLGTTFDSVMRHADLAKPVKEDRPLPFSWSACLLIKDNNIILPEWLAYHYTVLPLRRLIVGVDPSSNFDPQPIFDMYATIGMNITVWKNHSYWIDGRKFHEKKEFHPDEDFYKLEHSYRYIQDRLVYHQKIFYSQCLRTLKSENRTWTTVIDTDEYLAFNYYDPLERGVTWCVNNATCDEEYLDTIRGGTHFRTKLNQSATAAEYIAKNVGQKVPSGVNPRLSSVDDKFDNPDEPCIVLSRYLFVSKESDKEGIQRGVDEGFNATNFNTLRFRHRSSLAVAQTGKCIVDASRSPSNLIKGPHRLYGKECTGGNAHVHNAAMSFRVHHYVGSWESFRLRGEKLFKERNNLHSAVVDNTTPQYSSPENLTWLSQFVKLVGKEKALDLTQRIHLHEVWELEKKFLKLKFKE
mmetsp:Transcript_34442/g.70454  ORF Transcript_34442/g.70454 Transcript_34442/m.70454 type:complete len:450 (-) Transcript_34442:107-1456(-)